LASAYVVFNHVAPALTEVTFETLSGPLRVSRTLGQSSPGLLTMSFPAWSVSPVPLVPTIADAFGARPVAAFKGRDLLVLFEDAGTVRALKPDLAAVGHLDPHGVCVTAPGTGADSDVDFVSRFFAPAMGVNEDPVTGSTHTYLTPFWGERLGKSALRARQVSARGGELSVGLSADRVTIAGPAVLVIEGRLFTRAPGVSAEP
jgi:predicted PhzF superfamily epimerase YddE/YHI9